MEPNAIITALISALLGGGLWAFLGKKLSFNKSLAQLDHETEAALRDNLIQRVDRLENLLMVSSEEKEAMRAQIQELIIQVTELKMEIKYLRSENKKLREGKNV